MPYSDPDIQLMKKAIEMASQCDPIRESIPRVGAIIAIDGVMIAAGKRGSGRSNDDDHAEMNAFKGADGRDDLPLATLYTTLEPCTRDVRSDPLTACTELILQSRIRRLFIGILDPNQDVTGKGLWRLQTQGVEVNLFPGELAEKVRSINGEFIRSQETLNAEIISPHEGEQLKTYETEGAHPVRFKTRTKPSSKTHLVVVHDGQYFPQPDVFSQVDTTDAATVWEVLAHFGNTGQFQLLLVTTTSDLADILIQYYWHVVASGQAKYAQLKEKLDPESKEALLAWYYGVRMSSLPKGFRIEAVVNVEVVGKS